MLTLSGMFSELGSAMDNGGGVILPGGRERMKNDSLGGRGSIHRLIVSGSEVCRCVI